MHAAGGHAPGRLNPIHPTVNGFLADARPNGGKTLSDTWLFLTSTDLAHENCLYFWVRFAFNELAREMLLGLSFKGTKSMQLQPPRSFEICTLSIVGIELMVLLSVLGCGQPQDRKVIDIKAPGVNVEVRENSQGAKVEVERNR